ncbi:MAG: phenylalanine--tRNA ligase subunit beta [bacterium]
MLISYKWLQKYLPDLNKFAPEAIAEALTISIAEVENIHKVRSGLKNIVVGEIIQIEKVPDSDHLNLCQVLTDQNNPKRTIICGASNVKEGMKVAVCLPGGFVVNPKDPNKFFEIKEINIKGILSSGMICSPCELGLTDVHLEILALEPELPVGMDLVPLLQDLIFEVENKALSHRSDCFSHLGIARELSAILKIKFDSQLLEEYPIIPAASLDYSIEINVPNELCPRFCAVALKDVEVKNSPFWLQAQLTAVGIRAINNIVDVTNYIMLDKGQPMHAYDYDKMAEKKLIVRTAKTKEKVNALDEKTYELNKTMVVISDAESVEDIAGIMGGAKTQITFATKNIILEAANWEMYNIRKTSRTLGVRSEAGTRFEKGLDPNFTMLGLKSAVKLISDITDAEIASTIYDHYPNPVLETIIDFDINLISRLIGIDLSKQQIIDTLKSLQFEILEETNSDDSNVNQVSQSQIKIKVPTFRRDIKIKQDLLEEVARLFGYQNLKPTLPLRDLTPVLQNQDTILFRKTQDILVGLGFDELLTYSFTNSNAVKKSNLEIKDYLEINNPLSPELALMRNSLLPNLLEKVKDNAKNFSNFQCFEIGRVIESEMTPDNLHEQPHKLCLVIYNSEAENLFTEIKGSWEILAQALNIQANYLNTENNWKFANMMHPKRVALIQCNNINLGFIGEIHPQVLQNWELKGRVAILEINLDQIIPLKLIAKAYQPLSPYQEVTRDLSLWFDRNTKYADIIKEINSLNNSLIKEINLVDIFYLPENTSEKSITLRLSLQSQEKTLTDKEINETTDNIIKVLETKLKAKLRT